MNLHSTTIPSVGLTYQSLYWRQLLFINLKSFPRLFELLLHWQQFFTAVKFRQILYGQWIQLQPIFQCDDSFQEHWKSIVLEHHTSPNTEVRTIIIYHSPVSSKSKEISCTKILQYKILNVVLRFSSSLEEMGIWWHKQLRFFHTVEVYLWRWNGVSYVGWEENNMKIQFGLISFSINNQVNLTSSHEIYLSD